MKINTSLTPTPAKPGIKADAKNADDAPNSGAGATRQFHAPVPNAGTNLPSVIPGSEKTEKTDVRTGPVVPSVDVRNMSPRDMAELSLDLYANGILNWEEHEMLSFQPELNPAFNDTVGALTGETAEPDRPRDYLALWEKRLDFERKYNPENTESLRKSRQIVQVLQRLASPINVIT